MPRFVEPLCALIGVGLFVLTVYSGFAGSQEALANFAPTFIYVIFWVGLVVVSLLLGDVFRAFNPWLAVGRALAWIGRATGLARNWRTRPYPQALGRWPAVLGLLGFAWLELVYLKKAQPDILAALSCGYAGAMLIGMAIFGVEAWSRNGDAFGVYFNLYSHLSPLVRRGRKLHWRVPLSGTPSLPLVGGSVALLCVAIGTTTFDGFSNGPVWASLNPDLQSFFKSLGAGVSAQLELAGTVGLLGCVLIVGLFYRLGVRGMQTVGEGHDARELAGRFAHTLVPIAFAYALAHYFSLLVDQGQGIAYLISNPLGRHANIFGTAHWQINYNVVSSNQIWYVQVGALIVGHVCGLTLAHDRAIALYKRARDAVRSQYWMLVVMVGFTSLGLWLLSAVRQ
jgi:hypothetical protein